MGFDRGEIRIKATNISIMDRKGGKSIMGCRVMSGAISTTALLGFYWVKYKKYLFLLLSIEWNPLNYYKYYFA